MKIKSICKALLCLSLICSVTHAMQLTKVPQDLDSPQGYSGSSDWGSTYPNLLQTKFTVQKYFGDNHIQFHGMVNYVGSTPSEAVKFQQFMENCAKNYIGKEALEAPKEIKITDEDTIYLSNLQKFIIDNLFRRSFDRDLIITPAKFSALFESSGGGINGVAYKDAPLFYTLMYYFDDPEAETVNIKHSWQTYNNFKFEFARSPAEGGIKIDHQFKDENFNRYASAQPTLNQSSKDTVSKTLNPDSVYKLPVDASFKFEFYKIGEATYRMKVSMSTKEHNSQGFTPQKFTNILVKIKK